MRTILSLATFALLAAPALAQDAPFSEVDGLVSFTAHGHTLTLPLPDWDGQGPVPLSGLQPFTAGDEREALLEFAPADEDFNAWQHLHWGRMTMDPAISLDDMRGSTIGGFSQICREDATYFFITDQDDAANDFFAPLAFVCAAHAEGYGLDGLGQVMVAVFRKSADGVAVVTTEWRGPEFDLEDFASWPLSPDELIAHARAMDETVSLSAD